MQEELNTYGSTGRTSRIPAAVAWPKPGYQCLREFAPAADATQTNCKLSRQNYSPISQRCWLAVAKSVNWGITILYVTIHYHALKCITIHYKVCGGYVLSQIFEKFAYFAYCKSFTYHVTCYIIRSWGPASLIFCVLYILCAYRLTVPLDRFWMLLRYFLFFLILCIFTLFGRIRRFSSFDKKMNQ